MQCTYQWSHAYYQNLLSIFDEGQLLIRQQSEYISHNDSLINDSATALGIPQPYKYCHDRLDFKELTFQLHSLCCDYFILKFTFLLKKLYNFDYTGQSIFKFCPQPSFEE